MTFITRRRALQTTLMGAAAACTGKPKMTPYSAALDAPEGFFRHGVASGDPDATSVVLWTRLHAEMLSSAPVALAARWQLAADRDFSTILAEGEKTTGPAHDWTVKALAEGLAPGGTYYYRFLVGEVASPVGRTRTLPEGSIDAARFAVVSCTNYPFGYFNVYDQIARRDDIDAVIHLGDYIYEYGREGYGGKVGAALGREHEPAKECIALADYRRRHAQYKADPSSLAMHAAHPLIAIWDDHETSNNSWKGGAENHDPASEGEWNARRRAALQAYYEWMPVRDPAPDALPEALFRSYSYGDLLTVAAIETRLMARSKQFEYDEIVPTLKTPEDIARFRDEILWDESREMLGAAQIDFLDRTFRASVAAGQPWRLIANQVIMAEVIAPDLNPHVTEEDIAELEKEWDQARAFVQFSALGLPVNLDAWDGYPAARERFYRTAKEAGADGLIVVTGDTHTWWANDLAMRDGTPMGVELGVHSVTSPSPYRKEFLGGKGAEYAMLTAKDNKYVRYLSGEHHGYIDLEVRKDGATGRFMAVDTIEAPDYNAFEKASFAIRKSDKGVAFGSAKGLSFKEQWIY
ncbi:MAG: alkaline phosphatase D family protein [Pseudomonadota bacterium]|nr:alkaline phosphatase D family protein [Pseudomonadota bacterium]